MPAKIKEDFLHVFPDRVFTIKELSQLLNVGRAAICMAISKGRLEAERKGGKYFIKGRSVYSYLSTKHMRPKHYRYWSATDLSGVLECTPNQIYYLTYKNFLQRKKIDGLGYRYDMDQINLEELKKKIFREKIETEDL